MSDVAEPKAAAPARVRARLDIVDCDIHPVARKRSDIYGFMPKHWREHVETYGPRGTQPFLGSGHIPRVQQARLDSMPDVGPAGSDLKLMQKQLLDFYDMRFGILQPFGPGGGANLLNPGLANAICAALNDWQIAFWLDPEPRLKGSISLPQEDAAASVAELERHAANRQFAQITVHAHGNEPLGKRRYWPIFEAAQAADLPVAIHSTAYGQYPQSGAGWMSFYIEEHHSYAHSMQTAITSMIMEGVFDAFPKLRFVVVEGGFAWAPALAWRLDKLVHRNRSEVPHLKRLPSEYMRSNIWYATQPMEEPDNVSDLHDIINWIGADRLLFATDYPHWDMDDPRYVFKFPLEKEAQRLILGHNARELYNLEW